MAKYNKQIKRWSTLKCSDETKRFGVIAERFGNYYQIYFTTNKEEKFFCPICGRYHAQGMCGEEDIIRVKAKNIYSWLNKNKYTEE